MTTTIDEYVEAVRRELGPRRDANLLLVELRAQLEELAEVNGETSACAIMGDPREYAANLRADSDGPKPTPHVMGIPYTITEDPRRSAKRIFDPSNPNILVPKVMGIGWTINFGAVLVKLGLIRPDDLDDDVLRRVHPRDVLLACLPTVVLIMAAGLLANWGLAHLDRVPAHWGDFGRPDRWVSASQGLLPSTIVTAVVATVAMVAAVVLCTVRRRGWALIAVGIALLIGLNGFGITLARVIPQSSHTGMVFVAIMLVSFVIAPVAAWLPARAALRRTWRADGRAA